MATHRLPAGSYEDLFYKAITLCSAKDCTTICRRNQNTKSFKDFLEKLTDDFWYHGKDFSKDCDDYQKACHSLYRDGVPVPTCDTCRNQTLSAVRAIPGRVHAGLQGIHTGVSCI